MLSYCFPDAIEAFKIVTEQYKELHDEYTALLKLNTDLKAFIQNEIDIHTTSSCPCSPAGYDHELRTIVQIYENILNKINTFEKTSRE
jgi:hypothetical protein